MDQYLRILVDTITEANTVTSDTLNMVDQTSSEINPFLTTSRDPRSHHNTTPACSHFPACTVMVSFPKAVVDNKSGFYVL